MSTAVNFLFGIFNIYWGCVIFLIKHLKITEMLEVSFTNILKAALQGINLSDLDSK